MIIAYYSLGGNTDRVARMVQEVTGADMARIETTSPYVGSYDDIVDKGQQEVDGGFLPEIWPLDLNIDAHATVILGSPVWWYSLAPAMRSFLHEHDLMGKEVYPFATNGGWLGRAFEDCEDRCEGATIHQGLGVRFDGDVLCTTEADIRAWAEKIQER